jgi:ribosomal-protein-alanine N-acetyltransferase
MTEAAPSVISHCFRHLNAHRIEARIEPENLPSRRLATKLGFTEEGTLRDWLCVAGEFRGVVMYSLPRTECPYGDPPPFPHRSRPS